MTTQNVSAPSSISIDPHWGALPVGEAARMLGAGDPKEIVSGAEPQNSEDLND